MKLKSLPEDFLVEELPGYELLSGGEFCCIRVRKKGLTTQQAVKKLSSAWRIPERYFNYAGSKDRHAITVQYMTVPARFSRKEKLIRPELEAETLGYLDERLALGMLDGNRFVITVRELSAAEAEKFRESPGRIVNYFDEQRFGRMNLKIGLELLRKNYRESILLIMESAGEILAARMKAHIEKHKNEYIGALRLVPGKQLLLYVHSVQSWMWNEAARMHILKNCANVRELAYSEGKFVFPRQAVGNLGIPLVGFGSKPENDEIWRSLAGIMEEHDISPRDFIFRELPELSLEGGERELLAEVKGYKLVEAGRDELFPGKRKVKLEFSLPKGSYATIVVKSVLA